MEDVNAAMSTRDEAQSVLVMAQELAEESKGFSRDQSVLRNSYGWLSGIRLHRATCPRHPGCGMQWRWS